MLKHILIQFHHITTHILNIQNIHKSILQKYAFTKYSKMDPHDKDDACVGFEALQLLTNGLYQYLHG